MTQKTFSVSPLIPACPKSGASAPAFRPADQGDTAAPFTAEEVCLSPIAPSRAFPCSPFSTPCRVNVRIRLAQTQPSLFLSFAALPRSGSTQCSAGVSPASSGTVSVPGRTDVVSLKVRARFQAGSGNLASAFCTHFDPIVPHFFALYRQTKFSFFPSSLCLCVRIPKTNFLQTAELNQKTKP